jgi:predicted RNA-binding Zn-ribbon protein involved in translation (DUF1610 family)
VFAVIGLAFFGLIWYAGEHGGGVRLWLGIGGFVGSALVIMIIQAVRARSFHCPKCGQHIPVRYRDSGPNWDKGRYRVQFVCSHCDIIWDTGLRQ